LRIEKGDFSILHSQFSISIRIKRSVVVAVVATILSVAIGYPLSIEEDFVPSLIGNILYFFGWVSIQPDPASASASCVQVRSPETAD
jgi:hypothetical protein